MSVFVDTSAILAVLDGDDLHHRGADATWQALLRTDEDLISSSYVLLESFALVQRRLGMAAVRALQAGLVPVLDIQWVDEELHAAALEDFLTSSRRGRSLVDCTSFEIMRRRRLNRAFAFDPHFPEQGFEVLTT